MKKNTFSNQINVRYQYTISRETKDTFRVSGYIICNGETKPMDINDNKPITVRVGDTVTIEHPHSLSYDL
jgi:co-chaperonin GroES (HSP10)